MTGPIGPDPSGRQRGKLDYSKWARRLGFEKSSADPDIFPILQPSVLLADHRSVSPRIDTADALAGWIQIGSPGNYAHYELQANSPGGVLIHWWSVSNHDSAFDVNTILFAFAIGPPSGNATAPISNPINPLRAVLSTHAAWSNPVSHVETIAGAEPPQVTGGNNLPTAGPFVVDAAPKPKLWVPPGRSFVLAGAFVQQGHRGGIYFTELDVAGVSLPP